MGFSHYGLNYLIFSNTRFSGNGLNYLIFRYTGFSRNCLNYLISSNTGFSRNEVLTIKNAFIFLFYRGNSYIYTAWPGYTP